MVITGASSGIGLTTARLAAKEGARLVLAARNENAIKQLANEVRLKGGQAVHVVADVGKEEEVRNIAEVAIERFGGFDTWVNDAAIGIYGNLLDIATVDSRRLFDTNFWGVVYGSLEAARHLRRKEGAYGGAIINVGSEVSARAIPLLGMYSASKHAVKGFTDALRMELEKEKAPISVALVKSSAIDTPFLSHAKNYMNEEPTLPSPMYSPEIPAQVILHCAVTPERDMFAGGSAKLHSVQGAVMLRMVDWIMEWLYFDKQKSGKPANHHADALNKPTTGLQQRGPSEECVRETSAYTKASMHPLLTGAIVVGTGLAVAALLGNSSSRDDS